MTFDDAVTIVVLLPLVTAMWLGLIALAMTFWKMWREWQ